MAIFQIVILIIGIIALGYSVGQSFGEVDAENTGPKKRCTEQGSLIGCPFGYGCGGTTCYEIDYSSNNPPSWPLESLGGRTVKLNSEENEKLIRNDFLVKFGGKYNEVYLDYPGALETLQKYHSDKESEWGPQVQRECGECEYTYTPGGVEENEETEEGEGMTDEEKVQQIVNNNDNDGDGQLSKEEYDNLSEEDKTFLGGLGSGILKGFFTKKAQEGLEGIFGKKKKDGNPEQKTEETTTRSKVDAGSQESEEKEKSDGKVEEKEYNRNDEMEESGDGVYETTTKNGDTYETDKEGVLTDEEIEKTGLPKGTKINKDGELVDSEGNKINPEDYGHSGGIAQSLIDKTGSKFLGSLIAYAGYSAGARLLLGQITKWTGMGDRNANAIKEAGWYAAAGVATVAMIDTAVHKPNEQGWLNSLFGQEKSTSAGGPKGWVVGVVALAAMAVVVGISFQNYVKEEFTYNANSWQPPIGGDNCEKCNELEFGCNQYQCHSFGQACKLINENTADAICIEDNAGDSKPPIINPLNGTLPKGFSYEPLDVSLEETGVKIKGTQKDGCIPPFTALTFGVQTSEPAKCKIGIKRMRSYDNMSESYMSGGGINIINHTLYVPSTVTASEKYLEDIGLNTQLPKIKKGDEYNYYIRCQDTHGNENPRSFVVNFCVADKDLTPPEIKGYENIVNGEAVSFGTRSVETKVYLNEPAICKWDHQDVSYEQMATEMTRCDQEIMNMGGTYYSCTANFSGIKDRTENKYYIKCKDNPLADAKNRNTNKKSEVLTIKGSQPIQITSLEINGKGIGSTIKDSRNEIPITLNVKTAQGVDNGKTICQYEYEGTPYYFNMEYSNTNTQQIWLGEGDYEIPITCYDKAGNSEKVNATFTIEIDGESPRVVRAYYSEDKLIIKTNEQARCFYDTKNCDYITEEGIMMESSSNRKEHTVSWDSEETLYIKCEDQYGNKVPNPEECTIKISPYEV